MLGQIQRFQKAINPQGFPGGTFVTPVEFPSFLSMNRYSEFAFYANDNWSLGSRVKLNLGLRYDYFGPQEKSEPKFDSNFYYGDPNLDISTRHAAGDPAGGANGQRAAERTRARSEGCGSRTRTTSRRVSASPGT